MYKYKRKGFTLVELMAVIIIISLIALLTFPNIINQIKKTKKSNNKMIEDVVIEQAKKYVSDNKEEFDKGIYVISVQDLIDSGYITDELVKVSNDNIQNKYIIHKDKKYIVTANNYIELEYIKSSGTQYIDTQYYADENTNAMYKIEVEQYKKWGPHLLTGQYYAFPFYRNEGHQLVATRNQISLRQYDSSFYPNKIFEYKAFWNNKFFINDEEKGTLEGSSGKDTKPLFIGTAALDPSNTSYTLIGKIYYVKIYNNDNLVRDYIPVLDKNEVPCLYDKVEKKYYYNQGTGDFLYG